MEAQLQTVGRELLCCLFQDHLDLRSSQEQRLDGVTGGEGVERRAVERDHQRPLASVFGEVTVNRLAYRQRGEQNLYVADGALNVPEERASHGVRRMVAVEAAAGSFEHATGQVRDRTGLGLGKRQVEELAVRAAVDFDAFYAEWVTAAEETEHDSGEVLVLSADGKGIVMRAEALSEATARAGAEASPKLKTRLSKGRKRIASGSRRSSPCTSSRPGPRTAADILPDPENPPAAARQRPKARNKWLNASVTDDARPLSPRCSTRQQRRDPAHQRAWVALVDGNNHQIDRIKREARTRKVNDPDRR